MNPGVALVAGGVDRADLLEAEVPRGVRVQPNAEHVTITRALAKLTLSHTLADDLAEACQKLAQKGGLHEVDRRRAKTGTGY